MTDSFAPHKPVAAAIAALLHPHAEVVIHDLGKDRIVDIWNAYSNRKAGDPSLLGDDRELMVDQDVYGPYEKANFDGARQKSVSAALRDPKGKIIGLLCINIDVSAFEAARELLERFTSVAKPRPEALFRNDWREQINLALSDFLERRRKALKALDRDDKIDLIEELDRAGLFHARHAANHVADALNLSRATIYNLLRDARAKSQPGKAAE